MNIFFPRYCQNLQKIDEHAVHKFTKLICAVILLLSPDIGISAAHKRTDRNMEQKLLP